MNPKEDTQTLNISLGDVRLGLLRQHVNGWLPESSGPFALDRLSSGVQKSLGLKAT